MSNSAAQKKADERRLRNLASANASRQRRREQISALTQEKSRLNEANALLRARLQISSTATLPSLMPLPEATGSSRGGSNMVELGPALQQLVKRKEMDGRAIVDLLDRAVSGSAGKGPPLDPEAANRLAQAARKMPRNAQRPLKHTDRGGAAKPKPNASKNKPGSSSKKQ